VEACIADGIMTADLLTTGGTKAATTMDVARAVVDRL